MLPCFWLPLASSSLSVRLLAVTVDAALSVFCSHLSWDQWGWKQSLRPNITFRNLYFIRSKNINKYISLSHLSSSTHQPAPGYSVHVALLGRVNELGHGLHGLPWASPVTRLGRCEENVTLRDRLWSWSQQRKGMPGMAKWDVEC